MEKKQKNIFIKKELLYKAKLKVFEMAERGEVKSFSEYVEKLIEKDLQTTE